MKKIKTTKTPETTKPIENTKTSKPTKGLKKSKAPKKADLKNTAKKSETTEATKTKNFKDIFLTKKMLIIGICVLLCVCIGLWFLTRCNRYDFDSNADIEAINSQTSTMLPLPQDGTTPADHIANHNAYFAFTALSLEKTFTTTTEGEAITDVSFISVSQKIKANRVVNGNKVYKESLSHSRFKGVGVRSYVQDDNYIIWGSNSVSSIDDVKWNETANKISKDTYVQLYGHVANSITAYVLNDESILSSEYLGEENGIYSFKYDLDTKLATGKISLEMRTMSGTKSLPIFESVSLIIRMDKNWRVTETVTDCVYAVDMLGGVTCHETLTEKFFGYKEKNEIPHADFFTLYLDSEIVDPTPEGSSAIDYLMNGFSDYISGAKPIKVDLSLSTEIDGKNLDVLGKVQINLDLNELSNLAVCADITEITYDDISVNDLFIGYQNNSAYVKLDKFKARGTIEQINGMLGQILPLFDVEALDLSSTFNEIDLSSLLNNATLTKNDTSVSVNIQIPLGNISIDATLNFNEEEKVTFIGATATIGDINLSLVPNDHLTVSKIEGNYHDIVSLLDIIDQDNNINLNVSIGDITALVKFNLDTLTADIAIDDLLAKYSDNVIYLNYKDIKAKFNVSDFDSVMTKLSPILEGRVSLPDIKGIIDNLEVIPLLKEAISTLSMTEEENSLAISTTVENIDVNVLLNTTDGKYTFNSISLNSNKTEITVAPNEEDISTIDDVTYYNDIMPLINLIDDNGNVSFTLDVNGIKIDATINLITLKAFILVADVQAMIDFNTGNIYACYPGIKVKTNFEDLEGIIEEIKPIINKFAGETVLDEISFDSFSSIDLKSVLSSIDTTLVGSELLVNANVNDLDLELDFDISKFTMELEQINIDLNGININLEPSNEPISLEFNTSDNYINLKDLVNTYATPLKNVLLGDELSVSFGGEIITNGTKHVISTGDIKIADINSAPKANAKLVIDAITTDQNGVESTVTHTITLVYLDPSLVNEGAINVYFTYDNSLDSDILEGTFTTTKASETLDILKQIYKNMPELQDTLKPLLTPDANGNPTIPDFDLDLRHLLNATSFADKILNIDINGATLMQSLAQNILISLSTRGEDLSIQIPTLTLDDLSLSLSATFDKPKENEITEDLFVLSPSENAKDFSTINELLKTLSVTSEHRSFNISGNIGMSFIIEIFNKEQQINIAKDAMNIEVKLDVIDSKTYAIVKLTRNATNVIGISVWKDYDGVSTLYYDIDNKMIYIKVEYRTKSLFSSPKSQTPIYYKYTEQEFGEDAITPILNMLRLNSLIESPIKDKINSSSSTTKTPFTIESVLQEYKYASSEKAFYIKANLKPVISDIDYIYAKITHDDNFNLNTIDADLRVVNFISINLTAGLNNYNFQNTKALIAEQANSGKY